MKKIKIRTEVIADWLKICPFAVSSIEGVHKIVYNSIDCKRIGGYHSNNIEKFYYLFNKEITKTKSIEITDLIDFMNEFWYSYIFVCKRNKKATFKGLKVFLSIVLNKNCVFCLI